MNSAGWAVGLVSPEDKTKADQVRVDVGMNSIGMTPASARAMALALVTCAGVLEAQDEQDAKEQA